MKTFLFCQTMVSSLWLMCWYMSGSLCTSAGSKAYDLLGFGWSCFLEAVILFIPVGHTVDSGQFEFEPD